MSRELKDLQGLKNIKNKLEDNGKNQGKCNFYTIFFLIKF